LADHIQNHKVRRTQVMEEILPQNVNTQSFPDFRASLMGQNAGAYDLMMQNLQGQKAHTAQKGLCVGGELESPNQILWGSWG